jgi:hypothetical protein
VSRTAAAAAAASAALLLIAPAASFIASASPEGMMALAPMAIASASFALDLQQEH